MFDTTKHGQQSGAVEACWAHNPEVRRSKLRSAKTKFFSSVLFFFSFLYFRRQQGPQMCPRTPNMTHQRRGQRVRLLIQRSWVRSPDGLQTVLPDTKMSGWPSGLRRQTQGIILALRYGVGSREFWSSMRAWVRIPFLTNNFWHTFFGNCHPPTQGSIAIKMQS